MRDVAIFIGIIYAMVVLFFILFVTLGGKRG